MEHQGHHHVFLSYATRDRPVVKKLAEKLRDEGFGIWLDDWRLIAGKLWQEAIESALDSCNAYVICIGPGGLGDWQIKEARTAISRQAKEKELPVIPVFLPRAASGDLSSLLPNFLRSYTCVKFGETLDDEDAFHRLVCGIRGIAPEPDRDDSTVEVRCPYRGLEVFTTEDARDFFGREALTRELVDRLRKNPDSRFLAIVGSSGSGKSSLARAGLLAALKRGDIPGSEVWPVVDCKPGKEPLQSLALAFTKAFRRREEAREEAEVSQRTQTLGRDPHTLHIATSLALTNAPPDRRLVVLVDQFEEAFTCREEAQCRALIDNLLYAAMAPEGQTLVVLTLRADFYEHCADYEDLAKILPSDRQSLIGPMNPDELRNAIKNPAYQANCELEAGLTDLLLRDIQAQPGSLPLLEHALLQIWQRREDDRRLTIRVYNEIGGVAGALKKHAEEVYSGLTETEREICRRVFLRLVRVDEQGRVTKRRLELAELTPAAKADSQALKTVIDRLADRKSRLLTTDKEEETFPTVELAHEALITNWTRLKEWINEDLKDLKTHHNLEDQAARWSGNKRDPSFLYRGTPLIQAEEWAQNHPGELSREEQEFLQASVALRDEEVDQERRQRRRNMILLATAALTAVIVAGVMYYLRREAVRQEKEAVRQQRINLAMQLSSQAKLIVTSNPLISLLLGTKAVQLKDNLPTARGALLGALADSDAQPLGKPGIVDIAVAADHRSIVTISRDGMARLWSLDGEIPAAPVQTFKIEESVSGVALSSDRHWLLTKDQDTVVRLRDLHPGGKVTELPDENWRPGDPFSPDSQWLITQKSLDSDVLVLHDLSHGTASEPTHAPPPRTFTYSPDGQRLAVVLTGGTVEIWSLQAPDPSTSRQFLPAVAGEVRDIAFSPDGLWLAAAVDGNTADAEVWRLGPAGATGEPRLLRGCKGNSHVAVSRNGVWVYTWEGRNVNTPSCLWSGDPGPSNLPYATRAAFSSDGRWLAWAEGNGAVLLRDLQDSWRLAIQCVGRGQWSRFLLFGAGDRWLVLQKEEEALRLCDLHRYLAGKIYAATPDGTRLAAGPSSKAPRLWEPGAAPRDLQGADPNAFAWALSSDNSWLAASSSEPESTIRLWNLAENSAPRTLGGSATVLTFDPRGRFLATGGAKEAWLWDLRGNTSHKVTVDLLHTVTSLAFDPDRSRLAVGWDHGRVGVFPTEEAKGILDAPRPRESAIIALTFSPDGQWLAMADESGKTFLWSPKREIPLGGQDKQIRILAFSRDGRQIASGGQDGTIQVWSFDGKRIPGVPVVWKGHNGKVRALSFTADSKELITTGANDTVRHWPLRTEDLIRLACQKAGRNLTKEEWESNAPPGEPFKEGTPCGSLLR